MADFDKTTLFGSQFIPVNKIKGGLLGSAIGDALGWPQEILSKRVDKDQRITSIFQEWQRRSGGRFWNHVETIHPGEYSDDSQLLLATARTVLRGNDWFDYFCRVELPIWLLYERGGGRATKTAAKLWEKGIPPWNMQLPVESIEKYYLAGGNGVAMRILPHAFLQNQTPQSLYDQVILNGITTHGHPRALLGGVIIAFLAKYLFDYHSTLPFGEPVQYLLDNRSLWSRHPEVIVPDWTQSANRTTNFKYFEYWDQAINETINGLYICQKALKKGALSDDESVLRELGGYDPQRSGAGTVTSLCAIYLASRYASDPATGVLQAAFSIGTDTDTLASLVGGLLGTLHGTEWIRQEWLAVQDHSYIIHLAEKLHDLQFSETSIIRLDTAGWTKSDSEKVTYDLQNGRKQVNLASFGICTTVRVIDHSSTKNIMARSYMLETENRQHLYIKTLNRLSKQTEERKQNEVSKLFNDDVAEQLPTQVHVTQVLDPGIYINIFEVYLDRQSVKMLRADRAEFPDLRELRSSLQQKKLNAFVYAWENSIFGYGEEAQSLQNRGFVEVSVNLDEQPALTKRMILEGYATSLVKAGYTVFWNKEIAEAYQMNYPLLDIEGKFRLFRGFELRAISSWDPDNEKNTFGIIIDTVFTSRDSQNNPLSTSFISKRFGANVLKLILQKQGELSPSGAINIEAARSKLIQTIMPFVNARHSFELPCKVKAQLALSPTRVTIVDGGSR